MTRPWVEALMEMGPVQTSSVMMWNKYGRCLKMTETLLACPKLCSHGYREA